MCSPPCTVFSEMNHLNPPAGPEKWAEAVSYIELCRHVVGYGFCGAGEHDDDDGGDSYDWEAEQFFRRKINEWYIVDTDRDEQISFQDLRDARDP